MEAFHVVRFLKKYLQNHIFNVGTSEYLMLHQFFRKNVVKELELNKFFKLNELSLL